MAASISAKPKSDSRSSGGRGTGGKSSTVRHGGALKVFATPASANKEELRARVEKLERANATLCVKNKELRSVAAEAAGQVTALTVQLASSERRASRQTQHEAPAETSEAREPRPRRSKRTARDVAAESNSPDDHELGPNINATA